MDTSIQILAHILESLGITKPDLTSIHIAGQDPVLPSTFPLGTAAAAALAAIGYTVNDLWYLKTGRQQQIHITLQNAAIAMLSHTFLRINNAPPAGLWDPLSGFYQAQDGRWIQLHCNFPHHRQGVVDFLGCADERSAVEAAIRNWNVLELETKLADLGLCAAAVRTEEEWRNHPQGQAVANLPLLEIIKIGEHAPKPLPAGERPLSGIKALDLTRVIAGPVCGKTLAEHGATVMRIASPHLPFILPLMMDTGFGKLSAHIDLEQPQDHAQFLQLIKSADIFSQAYRPGGLAAKGFSPHDLQQLNPDIICIELTAYGHSGPWAQRHGYDSLVQCATGIVAEQSTGTKPTHLPAQALDYITGFLAAAGAMAALKRRAVEGGSYLVRLSLAQTAHWLKALSRVSYDPAVCQVPTRDNVKQLLGTMESSFGLLEYLLPVLQMSETVSYWDKPPVALGTHRAEWSTV